ncbi:MAG: DUF4384 domain-containing protein [Albidovulum sp.]|nr:DUF4384 domain-containing protein [Albidovulum sp.]
MRAEIRFSPSTRAGFGQVVRFPVRSNRDWFARLLVGNPGESVHFVAADRRIAAGWWQQIRMGRVATLVARRPAGRSHATLAAAAPEVSSIDRNLKPEQAAANAVAVPQGELSVRLGIGNPRGLYSLGDELELSVETSRDAHVAVLGIDTDGTATILYPYLDGTDNPVRRGFRAGSAASPYGFTPRRAPTS